MKPTKKRPAKRTDNPIIGKLLNLKYRINDTATTEGGWSDDMTTDKRYVQSLINDIRKHKFTKIAPEDAVMVGDRSYDMIGAKNNKVLGLGVLYGYGSRNELLKSGAKFLIESPEELAKVILQALPLRKD